MIVKLQRRNARYRDLTLGQPYVVIGVEGNHFRILNGAGDRTSILPGYSKCSTLVNLAIGLPRWVKMVSDTPIRPRSTILDSSRTFLRTNRRR